MRHFCRNNGLSITLFGLFLVTEMGLSVAGYYHYNEDREQHGEQKIEYLQYLTSASFLEATMENWESEFLQMGCLRLFDCLFVSERIC